jgi:hypothetical protein
MRREPRRWRRAAAAVSPESWRSTAFFPEHAPIVARATLTSAPLGPRILARCCSGGKRLGELAGCSVCSWRAPRLRRRSAASRDKRSTIRSTYARRFVCLRPSWRVCLVTSGSSTTRTFLRMGALARLPPRGHAVRVGPIDRQQRIRHGAHRSLDIRAADASRISVRDRSEHRAIQRADGSLESPGVREGCARHHDA